MPMPQHRSACHPVPPALACGYGQYFHTRFPPNVIPGQYAKDHKNGRKRQRGIFAIEGEWLSDLRGGLSFRPLLEIIRSLRRSPIVHRDAATREELFYYLRKWTQQRYARYSVLYLGFHGQEESILIGDARERDCQVRLDELAEELEGKCEKKIIYFGSCSTVGIDER
ncbi:MAG: hypothetical protein RLZZ436_2251, partial [Planctomycetota bacterium]